MTLTRKGEGPRRATAQVQVRTCAILLCILLFVRFVIAGLLPLSSDEAYYWIWSLHLSSGYLDHPPAVAWLIRSGTELFGDNSFGVRFGAVLASGLATVFVWRAAADLLDDEPSGALAALWFNLTLMVSVEMMAATPDAPAAVAAAALLYALVRLQKSADGRWWIAVGIAGGVALLSKLTALFLGAGVLLWLVADRSARRWLMSPWLYAGFAVALGLYLPNFLWNLAHDGATWRFQFSRVTHGNPSFRYLPEFLGAQIGLVSPFVFLLGAIGLVRASREARFRAVAALLWPGIIYFLVHALHDRVQGNWPSFLLPAYSIAAVLPTRIGPSVSIVRWSRVAAAPLALTMLVAVYAQSLFGMLAVGRSDPVNRLLAFGLDGVTEKLADTADGRYAALLVTDYASAGWFSFYRPKRLPVIVLNEPERWSFAPPAGPSLLARPLLYIAERRFDRSDLVRRTFSQVMFDSLIDRRRSSKLIASYVLYRVDKYSGRLAGRVLP